MAELTAATEECSRRSIGRIDWCELRKTGLVTRYRPYTSMPGPEQSSRRHSREGEDGLWEILRMAEDWSVMIKCSVRVCSWIHLYNVKYSTGYMNYNHRFVFITLLIMYNCFYVLSFFDLFCLFLGRHSIPWHMSIREYGNMVLRENLISILADIPLLDMNQYESMGIWSPAQRTDKLDRHSIPWHVAIWEYGNMIWPEYRQTCQKNLKAPGSWKYPKNFKGVAKYCKIVF